MGGGALEALGDNRQGAYYAVETASQIYSANVGSSALDNSIHNNTDSSRSLSLSHRVRVDKHLASPSLTPKRV
nr:hypothetical protein [Enterovibrio nigricans]